MEVELKYGSGHMSLNFPEGADVTLLQNNPLEPLADPLAALEKALSSPLDAEPFERRSCPSSVAVAVPDETRPFPLKTFLPVLLARIHSAWPALQHENIRIVIGGGLHPQPDEAQINHILPESVLTGGYQIISHDALRSPMTHFGMTSRGTPVEINAAVGTAEYKISVGMLDPHQFVGISGGSKGICVGCASKAMIENNHKLMSSDLAYIGNTADNPVRQDLNESGEMVGVDFALNVVLNPMKKPVAVLAGRPISCVEAGGEVSRALFGVALKEKFDIAVATCGGNPKDICLYQAQKGFANASGCLKDGGKLLMLAACTKGVGDDVYENYVKRFSSPQEQLDEFSRNGFRMGAHKAFLFSHTLVRFETVVHSEADEETLKRCLLKKVDAQATLDKWLAENPHAKIAVIPNANTMFFRVEEES